MGGVDGVSGKHGPFWLDCLVDFVCMCVYVCMSVECKMMDVTLRNAVDAEWCVFK